MRAYRWFMMLLSTFLGLTCVPFAGAGALRPCVKAISSHSGSFLVTTDTQSRPVGGLSRVEKVELTILGRESFINGKDRLEAPVEFWGPREWTVVFDASNGRIVDSCPLSLVTDDGEFLAVVNSVVGVDQALQIYRRKDRQGVLVRSISLKEMWPAEGFRGPQVFTDHSQQWYAGGTFEFSPDSRTLIHRTRWGNLVRINLADGKVYGLRVAAPKH